MKSATWEKKVNEVYYQEGSDSVMIFTEDFETGKLTKGYYPVAAWTDGESIVKAANKIYRITF